MIKVEHPQLQIKRGTPLMFENVEQLLEELEIVEGQLLELGMEQVELERTAAALRLAAYKHSGGTK